MPEHLDQDILSGRKKNLPAKVKDKKNIYTKG